MPKLLVIEDRNNRFGYRAEYIEVPKKELNQLKINPLYGGYVYITNKDMSDIFRVVSIDEIYLTKYNAEELKQFFKEKIWRRIRRIRIRLLNIIYREVA